MKKTEWCLLHLSNWCIRQVDRVSGRGFDTTARLLWWICMVLTVTTMASGLVDGQRFNPAILALWVFVFLLDRVRIEAAIERSKRRAKSEAVAIDRADTVLSFSARYDFVLGVILLPFDVFVPGRFLGLALLFAAVAQYTALSGQGGSGKSVVARARSWIADHRPRALRPAYAMKGTQWTSCS